MSHYTRIKTKIRSLSGLLEALKSMGFSKVQVFPEPQQLRGYQGDLRSQTAEVIIPKKHVGLLSNDIGFKRKDNGTFEAIISKYDQLKYSAKWLGELTQQYAYLAAKVKLKEEGFELIEETTEADDRVHLVLRRMV